MSSRSVCSPKLPQAPFSDVYDYFQYDLCPPANAMMALRAVLHTDCIGLSDSEPAALSNVIP